MVRNDNPTLSRTADLNVAQVYGRSEIYKHGSAFAAGENALLT